MSPRCFPTLQHNVGTEWCFRLRTVWTIRLHAPHDLRRVSGCFEEADKGNSTQSLAVLTQCAGSPDTTPETPVLCFFEDLGAPKIPHSHTRIFTDPVTSF